MIHDFESENTLYFDQDAFDPCTRLDPQCRKIHDLGAMDLAPSSNWGRWEGLCSIRLTT